MRRWSIKEIENLANKILDQNQILTPYVDVDIVIRSFGIRLTKSNFGDDVSGILINKANDVVIGYNEHHSTSRKRFTKAHELGHFVLKHGRDGLFVDQKKHFVIYRNDQSSTGEKGQEIEANAFAAALLMPEWMVKKEIQKLEFQGLDLSDDDDSLISHLANTFKVSKTAMTFRISNLGLLDSDKYWAFN